MKQRSATRPDTRRRNGCYRPHYEILESRLPLGDALLGALVASSLASVAINGVERDPVNGGATRMAIDDLDSIAVDLHSSVMPIRAMRTTQTEQLPSETTSGTDVTPDLVGGPMSAAPRFRSVSSLQGWHAFAADSAGLTAPAQGAAKAWHLAFIHEPVATPLAFATPTSLSETAGVPKPEAVAAYGDMPLSFEANHGQTDARVDFIARTGGYTAFLTPTAAVFSIQNPDVSEPEALATFLSEPEALATFLSEPEALATFLSEPEALATFRGRASVADASGSEASGGVALHMEIVGANPNAQAVSHDRLPGIVNYFIGNNPLQWHTNIPTFGRVEYQNVYPGIDLAYYSRDGQLEYDFIVSPGADPNAIALNFAGADELEISPQGDLIIHTGADDLMQQKPYLYQNVNGSRKEVAGSFELSTQDSALNTVAFYVGDYDSSRPLVIDPLVLDYSTYLGTGGTIDFARDIAVDSDGYAYVTGETRSAKFPATPGSFDETYNGGTNDVFVAKLNGDGSGLIYSTFLGGQDGDGGVGIGLDDEHSAYVMGSTHSTDFPTVAGSFDVSFNSGEDGGADLFVTKLNPAGSALAYSTYLGGTDNETSGGIAINASGNAYVIGRTSSVDFPTTVGAFDTSYNGGLNDIVVADLNPAGSGLTYSTYLGGLDQEVLAGIAIDADGSAYLTGDTQSSDFPTTAGAFDQSYNGNYDAFVAKISADGTELLYATFLGGEDPDGGNSIALAADGSFYVTGNAFSNDFPTTPGAFDTEPALTNNDGFITKFTPTGEALVYSSFLSDGAESAKGIAVDSEMNAYVTGSARINLALTPDAFDLSYNGGTDAFLLKLNITGSALIYSTYVGGSVDDSGLGIALENQSVYLTGKTSSNNFPTTPNAFKRRNRAGMSDAFVTKFAEV